MTQEEENLKSEIHTISVLVENRFGVLARVAGLFSGRGYNISSLTVHETHVPAFSKMVIVTTGNTAVLEQIDKQLRKLVNVVRVDDLTGVGFVEREIALIRVGAATPEKREHLTRLVEIFHGRIVSADRREMAVELSGRATRIDNFIELVREFGIIDMARSGRVAISG